VAATTEQGGIIDTEHWALIYEKEGKRGERKKKGGEKRKNKFEVSSPTGNQRKK